MSDREFSVRLFVSIVVLGLAMAAQTVATRADELMPTDKFVHAGLSPEDAARAMTVPPGFSVSLFAGEPDVTQPIAMAIDDRGRLWVAEAYSYPTRLPDDQAKDRILIFEDTDGDGHFDSRKVFTDKLNLVSGLEIGFGGVWVGAAPYLYFIPDRNQDDVPDGPPEALLDGWHYEDTHETLNAFVWGPDGWLYGCHGVFTNSLVGKPGKPDAERLPINAGVWRYHPTQRKFEVFAHGTSNPWGVDFDDHGQMFITACVIPHLYHVIQGGFYQRQAGSHFNPYLYDDLKTIAKHRHYIGDFPHTGNGHSASSGGGHAHAGAMIYLGGKWPQQYRDQIFMNNIHGARINQDQLTPAGSGYVGDRAPDFLLANDSWSQILYLTYGQDGNVFMIDWYDANQCHHLGTEAHDRGNGRIFKVTYGKNAPIPVNLQKQSDEELVALLTHSNDWYSRHARRILQERGRNPKLLAALDRLAFEHADDTRRLRGLWALSATELLDEPRLLRALQDQSPYVRGWAIQLVIESGQPSSKLLNCFVELSRTDSSPVVRLYLASAAQRLPSASVESLLKSLVAHSEDASDHNLPLMYWYAAEPLVERAPAAAFAILHASRIPLVQNFLVRRIAQTGEPRQLDRLIAEVLSTASNAKDAERMSAQFFLAFANRRTVPAPEAWPAAYKHLSGLNNQEVTRLANRLALKFGDTEVRKLYQKTLRDSRADVRQRLDALEALTDIQEANLSGVLIKLLTDPAMVHPALRALAFYEDPTVPSAVFAAYSGFTKEAKRAALGMLTLRLSYGVALLDQIEQNKIPRGDLTPDLVRQLRNHQNQPLNDRIAAVWGSMRDTPGERAREIFRVDDMLRSIPSQGNEPKLSLGRALFNKSCGQCHTLFGEGGKVGPDLTGSNRTDLNYILANIMDPSAVVGRDYQAQIITTHDGRVLTGLVKDEEDRSLTLVTASEKVLLLKSDIEQRRSSEQSMMPDDILRSLAEKEVRSLIAYLASPRQVPLDP